MSLNALSRAIISDITTPANRGKALAHVGIAFAICFIIGPPIGAYFASRAVPHALTPGGIELNIYAVPAILTLILLSAETIFLMVALPETRGMVLKSDSDKKSANGNNGHAQNEKQSASNNALDIKKRIQTLKKLQQAHFLFLGIFSGMEFTLTFLTFDCKCNLISELWGCPNLYFQYMTGATPRMDTSLVSLVS
jgi:MFS family permease